MAFTVFPASPCVPVASAHAWSTAVFTGPGGGLLPVRAAGRAAGCGARGRRATARQWPGPGGRARCAV